jgi:hypothetical protein
MQNTIKNHRIFTVKYLANSGMVSIVEARGSSTDRKLIAYDYFFDSSCDIAINYLQSLGINIVGYGETKDAYVLFSDSWDKGNGFINIKGEK